MRHPRFYVVQAGDSPARIAAREVGCPKCALDLVAANPHKPTVRYPNGFTTFQTLAVGERLNLPAKWYSGALDRLPRAYFESLPSVDGRLGVGAQTPVIARCHAFSGTIAVLDIGPGLTSDSALAAVLQANGFTNYFAGLVQNQRATINGVWESAAPLDTSKPMQDPSGRNAAQFEQVTDNGLTHPLTGPCGPILNPQNIQPQGPPPPIQPPTPTPAAAASTSSNAWLWGVGVAGAAGIVYLATRKPRR